eukprot:TRINITY_DN6073_c0_g1_i6.p1 TRINITY_DN6073_c0_g1~~TRINITY_DN6073_c0_g1_i6.p1  ORF type:complete len:273 (+),score=30.54 TRINITY_DN6073_c0_g1_i6:187-1005(+)
MLGSEAAGIVIAHGTGKASLFQAKRVTIMPSRPGVWTDYAVIHINDVAIMEDKYSWEECATALKAPLTALMFLDLARRLQAKAVASNAASSTIGRLTCRLLQLSGIDMIQLVRKPEKASQIAAEGAKIVLNTSEREFAQRYADLAMNLQVGLVIDSVGGELLTNLAALSPIGTAVCFYGSPVAAQTVSINVGDLYQGKILMAASVYSFWGRLHNDDKLRQVESINANLRTIYKVNVLKTFTETAMEEALNFYEENKRGASVDGKIIIKFTSF